MTPAAPRTAPRRWLRLPRRTARLRLTMLYGGLFLLSGVALVSASYVLFERVTAFKSPHVPNILHASALKKLLSQSALGQTIPRLNYVNSLLTKDTNTLVGPSALVRNKQALAVDQNRLTQAISQLTHAVHQLAKTSNIEAAQRASDSHRLLVTSGIALAIVTVLAVLVGWFIAGRMLRPIRTITRTARRISSSNLHERLALDGPRDELRELGDTLDDLFGRLDASFEAQQNFVANASHELRTPLTFERTMLQVALDNPDMTIEAWRSTAREVLASSYEQARLIEALLTLASGESRADRSQRIDLDAVVTTALSDVRVEAARMGLHVQSVTAPASLEGDPLLVERLVANLLNNAVRHNVLGGHLEVVTDTSEGSAVLRVTNSGAIVAPEDVERLFQPFQRLDPRRMNYRDGHGLGLSIVRAIANAHGAAVDALAVRGGGLTVRVTFPPVSNQTFDAKFHDSEAAT